MKVENGVRALAGSMILISVILTATIHHNFVWLTVFIGFNLLQSAFTHFCPALQALFSKNWVSNKQLN